MENEGKTPRMEAKNSMQCFVAIEEKNVAPLVKSRWELVVKKTAVVIYL